MLLEIKTLAFLSCITFAIQVIALSLQYRLNKTYRGVSWWLLGTSIWALGVILLPMVAIKSLVVLALFANPLIICGQIFIYIGVVRFFDQKENRRILLAIFVLSLIIYNIFIFAEFNLAARTLVLTFTFALLALMTAGKLFQNRAKQIHGSVIFTGVIFAIYGLFSAFRFFWAIFGPPLNTYADQGFVLILGFIVPIATTLLWTFGFIIMLNQQLNGENQIEKEKLQLIFNASPDAVLLTRLEDGFIVDVNAGFLEITGYTRNEIVENSTLGVNLWHKLSDREDMVARLKQDGICENLDSVFHRKDGSLYNGNLSAKIVFLHKVPHIISVVHDITKSKEAEAAVRESEALYRSILNASPDDITITDLQGHILIVSPAAKAMFGYDPEIDHIIGTQLLGFILPEEQERAKENIIRMVQGASTGPNEYHAVRKDQSIFDIEVNSSLIYDSDHHPNKMIFMVRDISERKQSEEKIQQLVQQLEIEKKAAQFNAITDSLTGLVNRRFFDEALMTEFKRMKRSGAPLSIIMLDVDLFKKYNDHYGHIAGDECLKRIGNSIKSTAERSADVVARYGGEEFVVILPDTDQTGAAVLAERIRKGIQDLEIPHAASDVAEHVTISLGVVSVDKTSKATAEQILSFADKALYTAKNEGRNRISIWTDYVQIVEKLAQ